VEVSRSSVSPRCGCDLPECASPGHPNSTRCQQGAKIICHSFGLAAPMCGACREQWQSTPTWTGEPWVEPIVAKQPQATDLRTPRGKTFPRA
jgi:hypothetical protein